MLLGHHSVTPGIKFIGTDLYTWLERRAVRVKHLVQELNTMSLARAQFKTAQASLRSKRSRTKRTKFWPRVLVFLPSGREKNGARAKS